MKVLGVKFAPLNVPCERRLQTLAVAGWISIYVLGQIIISPLLTLYLLIYTKLRYLMLLYLIWIWIVDRDISHSGGRSKLWVRSWTWWKYACDYFPVRLKKVPSAELEPNRNYLFCLFPHGIVSLAVFNAFGTEYSNYRSCFPYHQPHVATMSLQYYMPFTRDLALCLGGISASAKSINYILSKPDGGHICVLIPGGAPEVELFEPGNYSLFLKKRKGFIKLALKHGTPLVPVLAFGEPDLYRKIENPYLRSLQKTIRKCFGRCPTFFTGRGFFQYTFGLLPIRAPLTTVVGKPLELPKIEEPTRDQVEDYHEKFVMALIDLFEEQKYNYIENPDDKHLEIC